MLQRHTLLQYHILHRHLKQNNKVNQCFTKNHHNQQQQKHIFSSFVWDFLFIQWFRIGISNWLAFCTLIYFCQIPKCKGSSLSRIAKKQQKIKSPSFVGDLSLAKYLNYHAMLKSPVDVFVIFMIWSKNDYIYRIDNKWRGWRLHSQICVLVQTTGNDMCAT